MVVLVWEGGFGLVLWVGLEEIDWCMCIGEVLV